MKPEERDKKILEMEDRKRKAFERIDKEYYDKSTPYYRDNERYSWAVNAINKAHKEDVDKLLEI